MDRVNVYSYPAEDDYLSETTLTGWFDRSKAEWWSDADHNGNGSGGTGRGTAIIRTAQGKWVFQRWSNWQGESNQHEYISDDGAREWLLRNHEDEAVAEYFGEVAEEEDRRPGRPEVGKPVNVRLGDELLAQVDIFASADDLSRAEAVRQLVAAGLSCLHSADHPVNASRLTPEGIGR